MPAYSNSRLFLYLPAWERLTSPLSLQLFPEFCELFTTTVETWAALLLLGSAIATLDANTQADVADSSVVFCVSARVSTES